MSRGGVGADDDGQVWKSWEGDVIAGDDSDDESIKTKKPVS